MTKISKMLIYNEYLKKIKILVINHIIICKAVKIFYQCLIGKQLVITLRDALCAVSLVS